MSKLSSLRNVINISLGGIGIVVCVAALIAVWVVNAYLGLWAEHVFGKMDVSLVVVQQGVAQTRKRVQSAKITTDEIEKSLREWSRRELGEHSALRFNALEKVDRVSAILQQAGDWLEFAETSVGIVNDVLAGGGSTPEEAESPSLDQLIVEMTSLRAKLTDVTDVLTKIRERVGGASEEQSPQALIQDAAQLTLRVAASLGTLDSRFEKLKGRLTGRQDRLHELKSRAIWWIRVATIGAVLLISLMAAGQVALCRLAWKGLGELRHRVDTQQSPA